MARVVYKRFDNATVTAPWHALLKRCRRAGWRGGVNGRRGGSRTWAMQYALWLDYTVRGGPAAFHPNGPSRHMRRNIKKLGPWTQAVDVTQPETLVRVARRFGVDLHQPYPKEPWHVEARRPFAVPTPVTGTRGAGGSSARGSGGGGVNDRKLKALMKQGGIVDPATTLREARRAGLPLPVACALLEQESGGGRNVFGHDPTIFVGAGSVTKEKYQAYKRARLASGNRMMQGVGPCQLTWWEFQDLADRLGGCWNPAINQRVGFRVLAAHIRQRGLPRGLVRYNGSGPAAERYARQVLERIRKWRRIFGGVPRPDGGGVVTPRGPYAADFVALCLRQKGDRYVFGAEAKFSDANPSTFDCSELIEWALARIGVRFPDGSWNQEAACRSAGTLVPIQRAIRTQGALLFRHRGDDGHVAISLGNGSTIEARGRRYGVNVFSAANRGWTSAGLIPRLKYVTPPATGGGGPAWPGRYLTQPPLMRGNDVARWQRQMRRRGWPLVPNGVYGERSEDVCRRFQRRHGLLVDGIVGPDTWNAAWIAPPRAAPAVRRQRTLVQ